MIRVLVELDIWLEEHREIYEKRGFEPSITKRRDTLLAPIIRWESTE